MTDNRSKKEMYSLNKAYTLETPEDSVNLYNRWAETYDEEFAVANDYNYPDMIAGMYAQRTKDKAAPVLDVGAGTGLVGEGLAQRGVSLVDALDISAGMLEVSMRKGCYRAPIEADLTGNLDIPDASYGGITCAGTFTIGHVGPEAIDELIRIARPGALFILGINAKIYESGGFAAKFAEHAAKIRDLEIVDTSVYGKNASDEMQASRSSVAVFYKV